jgi:hypothetical protein
VPRPTTLVCLVAKAQSSRQSTASITHTLPIHHYHYTTDMADHHDDLHAEQTEGFKVGEKKTIDEYQVGSFMLELGVRRTLTLYLHLHRTSTRTTSPSRSGKPRSVSAKARTSPTPTTRASASSSRLV